MGWVDGRAGVLTRVGSHWRMCGGDPRLHTQPRSLWRRSMAKRLVCIGFLTMVLSQVERSNLEAEYYRCAEYRAIPTTNLYRKMVPRWNGTVSEMQHQVSLYTLCGGHWRNISLRTQHGQNMQASKALEVSILQYPTAAVERF